MLIRESSYTYIKENLENLANLKKLAKILDKVGENKEIIVIKRENKQDVALIAADELSNLLENLYLLRSPENAKRLFRALEWANSEETPLQSIEELKEELGIE